MAARDVLALRMAHVERMCDAMDNAVEALTQRGYQASLHVSGNTIPEFLILFLDVAVAGKLAVSGTWSEVGFHFQPHGKTRRNASLAAELEQILNEAAS
jgi:hypothetical protein